MAASAAELRVNVVFKRGSDVRAEDLLLPGLNLALWVCFLQDLSTSVWWINPPFFFSKMQNSKSLLIFSFVFSTWDMLRVCCRHSQSSVNLSPQHDANYSCSFVNTLCSSLFLLALDNRAQTHSHVQEKYFLCARARVTKSLPRSNLIPSLAFSFSVWTTFVYTGGKQKQLS